MIVGVDSDPLGATDAGAGRELREQSRRATCLARMPGDVYCMLSDGHERFALPHSSLNVEPRALPVNAFDKGTVRR